MRNSTEKTILSVSELNQYARGVLEMHIGKVWVNGEISNFSQPASGHWYFTLKDQQAQIRCAMFRNNNRLIRCKIENGVQVLLNGSVSIYEGRGEYQLIIDYLEEAGAGNLQRQFEQLKNKLQAEGLFDSKHKQAIPKQPRHIAVITSATGAAIHDILCVLKERFPLLKVTLIPCSVQGEKAAAEICAALLLAERWNTEEIDSIDTIILGRGGGSLEDLWPFNEESVARAIFSCKIPIISAVGHEVDTTIADYVADLRAPTPSAAAETISPDQKALSQQLDYYEQHLLHRMQNHLAFHQKELLLLQKTLRHPGERLQQYHLRFNQLEKQLINTYHYANHKKNHQLQIITERFKRNHPNALINDYNASLTQLNDLLCENMLQKIDNLKNNLAHISQLIETVSPLATLQRGYAIITDSKKTIIRHTEQTKKGDVVTAKLANGELLCEVKDIS